MNCADSVLSADELPVRGIDQCRSTFGVHRAPALSWWNGTGCRQYGPGPFTSFNYIHVLVKQKPFTKCKLLSVEDERLESLLCEHFLRFDDNGLSRRRNLLIDRGSMGCLKCKTLSWTLLYLLRSFWSNCPRECPCHGNVWSTTDLVIMQPL